MSENIILIVIFIIILIIAYLLNNNNKTKKEKAETLQLAKEIKNKLAKNIGVPIPEKSISAAELISNNGAMKNQVKNGGIINKNLLQNNNKPKAANWTESISYKDDIKKINIDDIFKNNESSNEIIEELGTFVTLKPSILLIDDSMVVRKYVGDLLKKNEYNIIIKNDGLEAYKFLIENSQKPDLIISDIEMPNMNGIELIEKLRMEKRFLQVPILVISAHAASHLKLMEEEHIQGFIKKPFEDNDLLLQCNYLINN